MGEKTVKDIGELGVLKMLRSELRVEDPSVIVALGDDAAVVRLSPHVSSILTTDMLVEGTHFDLKYTAPYDLGRKAIAVNVSDIAAMGGTPSYVLTSIALPENFKLDDLQSLYRGMKYECAKWGCALIGGDTVYAPLFVISVTMMGSRKRPRSLSLRSKALSGQNIYVTGTLGESRAGLELLKSTDGKSKVTEETYELLTKRHLLPVPRLAFAQHIVTKLTDVAMIDVSDGLFNELHLIGDASNIGMVVRVEDAFQSKHLKEFCTVYGKEPFEYTLFGGEDFELLFTTSASPEKVTHLCKDLNPPILLSHIGETADRNKGITFYRHAKQMDVKDLTYKHFGK